MNNSIKSYWLSVEITVVLILATVLVAGCGQQGANLTNGVVSEITMSTSVDSNNRPVNPTTVFPIDAVGFYCSFKLSGFPVGAKLEAQWIYVGGDTEAEAITGKNYVAETQTATITTEGQGYTYTVYTRGGIAGYENWPKGDYKVVINVDGQEKASTYFKVQ
jgi:hypothetical protein